MRWAVLLLLLVPSASACSWSGPEGWARLDLRDWSHESHQLQGLMADGSCKLETPFDMDEAMVWLDDGYDRRQVGIDDGSVQVVHAPGDVLDVAVVGSDVYAAIRLQAADVVPGMVRLMHYEGTWQEAANQPPPGWTGALDGPHAATRVDDTLAVFDFVQGRTVATTETPSGADARAYLGFDEGRFWFFMDGTFIGRGVGPDAKVETPHEEIFSWAVDGDRVAWQGYPEDHDGPVLWIGSSDGPAQEFARWPNGAYLGDVALLQGDDLVVVAFGIEEWRATWAPPVQEPVTTTASSPPLEESPAPLWLVLAGLLLSKTVSRRRG